MQSLRVGVVLGILAGLAAGQTSSRILNRFGAAGADSGMGIGIDGVGNIYVAATFSGQVSFDPAGVQPPLTSAGLTDIAILKYTPQGDLVFQKRIGGTGADTVGGFWIDPSGNIYLGGSFSATVNFDPNGNNFRTAMAGRDAFLAQYSPDGRYQALVVFSGSADDEVVDVAVDRKGNVAVACITKSPILDTNPMGGNVIRLPGPIASFVTVLDNEARFLFTPVVANGDDDGYFGVGVAFDPAGVLYVGGGFSGELRMCTGTLLENLRSRNDAFIGAFLIDSSCVFGISMGGFAADSVATRGVAADANSVYVAGTFEQSAWMDKFHSQRSIDSAGGKDIFLARYNRVGDLAWVQAMGGPEDDAPRRLLVDSTNQLLLAGAFRGTATLSPRPTTLTYTAKGLQGATDGFCGKYGAGDGSSYWMTTLGAANSGAEKATEANAAVADINGYVSCVGRFFGAPVVEPDGVNTTLTSAGDADIFMIRYDPNGRIMPKIVAKPSIAAVLSNAAGVSGSLAPGGIHSLYGDNLTDQAAWAAPAYPLQTTACGLTVKITDAAQKSWNAPLYYCAKTQINFIAPSTLAVGAGKLEVAGVSVPVTIGDATPALYDAAIIFATGAKAGSVVNQGNPASAGDVLTSFCTGLGLVTPTLPSDAAAVNGLYSTQLPVTATVGGQTVNVLFSGLSSYAGLYQVNFIVPGDLGGKQKFQIKAGLTATSNAVDLWLR